MEDNFEVMQPGVQSACHKVCQLSETQAEVMRHQGRMELSDELISVISPLNWLESFAFQAKECILNMAEQIANLQSECGLNTSVQEFENSTALV